MSEPIFSLEEIAEAFKYIQDNKLSTDAKAMLTMDIGYEKAEKDIIKLLEDDLWHDIRFVTRSPDEEQTNYHDGECLGCRLIALIKGGK